MCSSCITVSVTSEIVTMNTPEQKADIYVALAMRDCMPHSLNEAIGKALKNAFLAGVAASEASVKSPAFTAKEEVIILSALMIAETNYNKEAGLCSPDNTFSIKLLKDSVRECGEVAKKIRAASSVTSPSPALSVNIADIVVTDKDRIEGPYKWCDNDFGRRALKFLDSLTSDELMACTNTKSPVFAKVKASIGEGTNEHWIVCEAADRLYFRGDISEEARERLI